MAKWMSPEQVVAKLRQIEVLVSQEKSMALTCKEAGVVEQSYYRWRREYGGLGPGQAKRLKDPEQESARPRRLAVDLSLVEKQVPRDVAQGNSWTPLKTSRTRTPG